MSAIKLMDHITYTRKIKRLTYAELMFTIKDCRETLRIWPEHPNSGYYLDEIYYCSDEIKRRMK